MLKLSDLKVPHTRYSKKRVYLYAALMTGLVAAIWWALVIIYNPTHVPAGAFDYRSLDLSAAAKATYSNEPISVVKDLGIHNNVRQQLISFDVPKDGLSEYGLMTLPKNKPVGKYPVIILCHGYSSPQAYSTLESYIGDMDFYSRHGFAVIKPDYRGNGFSLTDGTPDGAFYSMSYNTDVMSLIAAVKSTSYLDKNNINMWGHSMGGYVALRATVLSPDVKNLILLAAPVGTPQDLFADYTPISDTNNSLAQDIRQDQLALHGTPLSNPTYWNKTSPLSYLANTKAHIEINVGTADKIVPPKFSADLSQALDKLNITHQYFVYKGGPHGLGRQRSLIWSRSLSLLVNNKF
ncbi:MAG TPA: alpha/beta fold hydrolase [Candidatus Saccharimonadales bacterium]|nr:alpha/beta fold hydrolase [Candidatus Saccharimonadales bacterium]